MQGQLDAVVVQAVDLEVARLVEAHDGRADLHFGTCAVVGGDAVGGGQRPVDDRRLPFALAFFEEPDLAAHFGNALVDYYLPEWVSLT